MLVDSESTVTNKCSDVDGPPLKKVLLGRSHILLSGGVGCCHYHLGLAMCHAFLISCDEVEFHTFKKKILG